MSALIYGFILCFSIVMMQALVNPLELNAAETPTVKKLVEDSVSLLLENKIDEALVKLDQVLLLTPNHPEAYFRKGQAFLQKRQFSPGIENVIKSTQIAPRNIRYSLYLAQIYTLRGKLQDAMDEYQRIIDTGTRDGRIKEVEKLLSIATGRSLAQKKETSAALLIFNGLLLEYPNDPQVLYNIGNAYMILNRIEEAENTFSKLHSMEPSNETVNMTLARIFDRTQRPELAMEYLKKVIDLNKKDKIGKNAAVEFYIIEGREHLKRQQWQLALDALQKVVTIDPSRTEAFFNISMANLRLGNSLMAERGFLSVLKVAPNNYSARLNLGQMYFDIGKTPEAMEQLQYIIDNDKSRRYGNEAKKRMNVIHSIMADKALKSGDFEESLKQYETALSYFSANTKASFTRGMIFINQKKFGDAQKEFESVIRFSPKNIQARANLANIYEQLRKYSKAAEQYEIIMDLDKDSKAGKFAKTKWKITKARGLWGDRKLLEAEKIFNELTIEQPNNFQVFALLGVLQSAKGKLNEAAKSYQRVLDLRPTNYAVKILLGKVYEQLGLDSLAANEYRAIIFAGGRVLQVPEAELRLAAVESRLSGFSNTLSYRFVYDDNLTLNDAAKVSEVRSDLALNFNYAMKTRDDLAFNLTWSPTYSTYHILKTDYLRSTLRSNARFGTPEDSWNISFARTDQETVISESAVSQSTSINAGRSKKLFAKAFLDLSPVGFEAENIASTVNGSFGMRHIRSFRGAGLESINTSFSLNMSQTIKWGVTASIGYSLGIYRNLKFVETLGGPSSITVTNAVSGLEESRQVRQTVTYNSDDFEFNSHTASLSLQKVLAPGFIGLFNTAVVFTGYTNVDSGSFATQQADKRMNLSLNLSPSITYMFVKDIRFVVSATAQITKSSLPIGLSGSVVELEDDKENAIASFQSTSLGAYSRLSIDAAFIMNF